MAAVDPDPGPGPGAVLALRLTLLPFSPIAAAAAALPSSGAGVAVALTAEALPDLISSWMRSMRALPDLLEGVPRPSPVVDLPSEDRRSPLLLLPPFG